MLLNDEKYKIKSVILNSGEIVSFDDFLEKSKSGDIFSLKAEKAIVYNIKEKEEFLPWVKVWAFWNGNGHEVSLFGLGASGNLPVYRNSETPSDNPIRQFC